MTDKEEKTVKVEIPVIGQQQTQPTGNFTSQTVDRLKTLDLQKHKDTFWSGYKWVHQKIYTPVQTAYLRLPGQLTELKRPYLAISEHTRLFVLTGMTLAIAGTSRRYNQSYLKTIRNVIFSFYGLGLIVAPEVYSPFMRKELR